MNELSRDQTQFLSQLINGSPDIIYVLTLENLKIEFINQKVRTLLGVDADQVYKKGFDLFLQAAHPNDYSLLFNHLFDCTLLKDDQVIEAEVRFKINEDEYHWFNIRHVVFNRNKLKNTVSHIVGTLRCLTLPAGKIHKAFEKAKDTGRHPATNENRFYRQLQMTTESRWLLQTLLDNVPICIHILEPVRQDGTITDFAVLMMNKSAQKLAESKLPVKFMGQTAPFFYKKLARLISAAEKRKTDTFLYTFEKDGLQQYLSITYTLLGEGILVQTEDITERKRREEQLNEQAGFISGIARATPDIIFVMNLDSREIIYINRRIEEQLGYSVKNIASMKLSMFEIMHEDDKPLMLQHLEQMKDAADGEIREIEYRLKRRDGSVRWYLDRNTVFKRNQDGVPVEKISIAQDITMRKKQQKEIIKALSILNQAEELAQLGSWDYEVGTGAFNWSEGMYRIFGMQKQAPVKPVIYIDYILNKDLPLAEKVVKNIEKLYTPFEAVLSIKVNGEVKKLKIKAIVINNEKGQPVNVLGVDMDITAIIRAEEKLQELNQELFQSNRQLQSLHSELQTLNSVVNQQYQESLQQIYTSLEMVVHTEARNFSNAGKANLRRTQALLQRLNLLTRDIRSYSAIRDDEEKKKVNLAELVQTVLNDLSEKIQEANATIQVGRLPVILGNELLLSVLFNQLLLNALKFKKEGIELQITITTDTIIASADAYPEANPGKKYTKISIRDNGIGFDRNEKLKIFEMFYRVNDGAKSKIPGKGLAIARKIMHLHNGFIDADSNPGNGTVINCYFEAEA